MLCAVVGVGGYALGIPLAFFWVARVHRGGKVSEAKRKRVDLLVSSYHPNLWFMESIEMIRKLILTSVVVLVSPGSTLQLYVGSLVCAFCAILYIKLQPYRDVISARVQAAIVLQLMATYLTATLFVSPTVTDYGNNERIGSLVLYSNTGAFVVILVGLWRGALMSSTAAGQLRLTFEVDDQLVELVPPKETTGFHLFLSHVWKFAQDQVATIQVVTYVTYVTYMRYMRYVHAFHTLQVATIKSSMGTMLPSCQVKAARACCFVHTAPSLSAIAHIDPFI